MKFTFSLRNLVQWVTKTFNDIHEMRLADVVDDGDDDGGEK